MINAGRDSARAPQMRWLRPSVIDGWRRLSARLHADPLFVAEEEIAKQRTAYVGSGFDYEAAADVLKKLGPAPNGPQASYRALIGAVAKLERPSWLSVIPRGRMLLESVLDVDARGCFARAGLLDGHPDDQAVELLDQLAQLARGWDALERMDSARKAERLSLEVERRRCAAIRGAQPPVWVALDNNAAGYDILSSCQRGGQIAPKYIEVKSSRATPPVVFLSRNEWEVGSRSPDAWVLHCWIMHEARLVELTWDQLRPHVPNDAGVGRWEIATISPDGCSPICGDL